MERKYYDEIDMCKGIGIILVVLGHALKQTGSVRRAVTIPLSVIYSFHMPLFFMLSGFLAASLLDLEGGVFSPARRRWIGKRAVRLLIPYTVMSLLYLPLKLWMNRFALKTYDPGNAWRILIGDSPNTAMWFLYILFLCCLVGALLVRRSNLNLVFFAAMLFSSAAYALNWQIRFPRYFVFFVLGLMLREYYEAFEALLETRQAAAVSLIFFVIGNIMGFRFGGLWYFLTAVTGSHLCLCLADFISDRLEVHTRRGRTQPWQFVAGWVRDAGLISMDIYIFSEPVITAIRLLAWNILHLPAWVCILLCFAGGLLIPIPVCRYIVRRVKVLRLLFLGEK